MDVKILNVFVEDNIPTKNGKGVYSKITVTYSNNGKVEAKQIFPFSTAKDVFEKIKTLQVNETYSITTEKDANGYWVWTDIARQDGAKSQEGKGSEQMAAARPQYETADERTARQVYIIKQSSLATAVNLLKTEKNTPSADEVIAVAQQFVDYVLGREPNQDDIVL